MEAFKKYFLITLMWLFVYFYPTFQFILLVGFFVIADTFTGVLAAHKKGEHITSKKFRAVIPKFAVYGVAVFVSHVMQQEFISGLPALKLVAGLIAFSELMSIDENIKAITGKSLFKSIIKRMQK